MSEPGQWAERRNQPRVRRSTAVNGPGRRAASRHSTANHRGPLAVVIDQDAPFDVLALDHQHAIGMQQQVIDTRHRSARTNAQAVDDIHRLAAPVIAPQVIRHAIGGNSRRKRLVITAVERI